MEESNEKIVEEREAKKRCPQEATKNQVGVREIIRD